MNNLVHSAFDNAAGRLGVLRTWRSALWFASAIFMAGVGAAGGGEVGTRSVTSLACYFDLPHIETNGNYVRLTLAEGGQLHRIGEPAIPFRTARLLIPRGCAVEKAEAVPLAEAKPLEGNWRVEFAGQAHCRPGRGKGAYEPGANRFVYDSDAPYPASSAELVSVQRMAGFDIALVRVFPVQYHPASGKLIFTPRLSVQLHLAPAGTSAEPPIRPPNRARAEAQVAAFVDNPELLESLKEKLAAADATTGEAFDYLLITSSNLVSAFEPLVARKTQDGLAVKVATIEAITNSITGRDVPEQVRNYIRQAYTNWGISYVLLGGTTAVVPCRQAYVRVDLPAKDSYVPCDLYYACLDGTWNANGDRHWGEPTDGENGGDVDLLAEVYVGRAPVSTVEQVRTFVEKSVCFETQTHPHPTQAVLMATFLGEFPTGPCQGVDMFKDLLPLMEHWSLTRLDDQPHKLPQWGRAEAVAALNQSPQVVLYNGHGNADILMRMRTPDLARLTNQWPFLACSVGCSAGEFDHGKFWPDSFGETLINGGPHGAFAAILNARAGWFDPQYPWKYSGEFQTQFFEELLRRGHRNLGMAHQRSKENLIGQVENSGCMTYRWCYYEMTLLGDPHLEFQIPGATRQSRYRNVKEPDPPTGARSKVLAALAGIVVAILASAWFLNSLFSTKPAPPAEPGETPVAAEIAVEETAPSTPAYAARAKPRNFGKRRGAPRHTQAVAASSLTNKPPAPTLEAQWGIQVCGMRLSMANSIVDLRYKVLDPGKAIRLADGKTASYILDPASGTKLIMPTPPREGAFPTTANKLAAGKTYFAMVANRGGTIKSGSKVTVLVGGSEATNLIVE
ncbi:MAG: C25 family cysteine peptidase [Verrucomicrobia bacterium]|nr:C25 family cysteine peptidase [Verrucomicrobiota bacterium]